jgi:hypothetical protein
MVEGGAEANVVTKRPDYKEEDSREKEDSGQEEDDDQENPCQEALKTNNLQQVYD